MSKVDGRAASPLTVRSLSPLGILNAALRAVPALKYALGVAGLAVLGAVVVAALGKNIRVAVIVLGGMLVAMVDGSSRVISRDVASAVYWAAVTPAGGEMLDDW